MKESYQKTATATLRQSGTSSNSIYINRSGRPVALPSIVVSSPNFAPKENLEKLLNDSEDSFSIKGQSKTTVFFV